MDNKIRPGKDGVVTPERTREFLESIPIFTETTKVQFLSSEEMKEIQNANLCKQMERVKEASNYYKKLFKKNKIDPDKIKIVDDIKNIPLTYKKDYMQNPEDFRLKLPNPTLYDWLWDVTYTTGTTTGVPTPFYNSIYDYYAILLNLLRAVAIGGGRPDDIYLNLFPLGPIPHIGFLRSRDIGTIMTALGFTPCTGMPHPEFPIHRPMKEVADLIEQRKPNEVLGIGSFIRRLLMEAEKQKRDFSSIVGIEALGEAVPKAMRDDMSLRLKNMGADEVFIRNSYGFTEMQGATTECTSFSGTHNPSPDLYYFEIVDEKTQKRLPDGEPGLITITHLKRTGTVLLRYVIGDIAALSHEKCPHCGRTCERVIITTGSTYVTRTSELVKLKGTLINPEVLRDAVANVKGVGEYQIIFTKKDTEDPFSPDELLIKIAPLEQSNKEEIEKEVYDKIVNAMEMRPKVQFVELSEIFDPKTALKATRIVDMRPKVE